MVNRNQSKYMCPNEVGKGVGILFYIFIIILVTSIWGLIQLIKVGHKGKGKEKKWKNAQELLLKTPECREAFVCFTVQKKTPNRTLSYPVLNYAVLNGTILHYCIVLLQCNTALYCATLHCTALYCTSRHCTILHCTALQYIALHCTTLHYIALHCTALHYIALHCTALYCTALHCNILHFTAQPVLSRLLTRLLSPAGIQPLILSHTTQCGQVQCFAIHCRQVQLFFFFFIFFFGILWKIVKR